MTELSTIPQTPGMSGTILWWAPPSHRRCCPRIFAFCIPPCPDRAHVTKAPTARCSRLQSCLGTIPREFAGLLFRSIGLVKAGSADRQGLDLRRPGTSCQANRPKPLNRTPYAPAAQTPRNSFSGSVFPERTAAPVANSTQLKAALKTSGAFAYSGAPSTRTTPMNRCRRT